MEQYYVLKKKSDESEDIDVVRNKWAGENNEWFDNSAGSGAFCHACRGIW